MVNISLKLIVPVLIALQLVGCKMSKFTSMPNDQLQIKSIYIFGYGSLINPKSVNRTLKREISIDDLTPCCLSGYKRAWNVKDEISSTELNRNINGVFLNLKPSQNEVVWGVIFEVTEAEFEQMKMREKNYNYVDVSDKVKYEAKKRAKKLSGIIYTFVAKPEYVISENDSDVFVMKNYIKIVEEGLSNYSKKFQKKFWESTEPILCPILEGSYLFLDSNQRKSLEQSKKQ